VNGLPPQADGWELDTPLLYNGGTRILEMKMDGFGRQEGVRIAEDSQYLALRYHFNVCPGPGGNYDAPEISSLMAENQWTIGTGMIARQDVLFEKAEYTEKNASVFSAAFEKILELFFYRDTFSWIYNLHLLEKKDIAQIAVDAFITEVNTEFRKKFVKEPHDPIKDMEALKKALKGIKFKENS
jgi:hypothetical protein